MIHNKKFGLCMVVLFLGTVLVPLVSAGIINSTTAEGFIVYGESNTAMPRYRIWNDTTFNFTAEASASSLGTSGTDDPQWTILRANHERDELVLGTLDSSNDVNLQIFNATRQWGNLLEVSVDAPNSAQRAFDIAVEDVSGDVLIVYENSSAANNVLSYRIWNGTYTTQRTLVTGLSGSPVHWVQASPRKGADDVMLVLSTSANDIHAALWNGSGFELERNFTLTTNGASAAAEHFSFAWESSGQGLAVYGDGNNLVYRTFSPTAPHWSNEASIDLGNTLTSIRLCPDPIGDYIGIIAQDSGNDVNVRMWDGTQILVSPPAEDAQTEPSGADSANVDCTWFNSNTAVFGFVDFNSLAVDYFNFTKSNSWGTADLTITQTTADFASDDIAGLRFFTHPTTERVIAAASDIAEDVSLVRWTGSVFGGIGESPIETSSEVLNGDQEGFFFAWSQYDPVPNVTSITPSGNNFARNALVPVNITVFDNINVSAVLANVTLPNGSMISYILRNVTGSVYNFTFNLTSFSGYYTVHAIANDTSAHQNVNASVTSLFTVGDFRAPNVTNLTTIYGTSFPLNTTVNITVNITDDVLVSAVLVNVTAPNGSVFSLFMTNNTGSSSLYNVSFAHTASLGYYTYRVIANDTSTSFNNINSSETGLFAIGDVLAPNVTDIVPIIGSNFNPNAVVNISVNVSDNSFVSVVLANVTLPNSTVRQVVLSNGSAQRFNASFTITNLLGSYSIRVIANDTANNNVNSSEFSNFTVGNAVAPSIVLTSPSAYFNASKNYIGFTFTATDDNDAFLNCSLLINATSNLTMVSVVSGQSTVLNITGFKDADYNWSVACNDSIPNHNVSMQQVFTVDTAAPQFNSLTTSPGTAADLDPFTNVTVLADISDNTTSVQSVILQYKLSNESDTSYVNVTMVLSNSGLFNASFNATQSGTYQLRLFALDGAGNKDLSTVVSVVIEFDRNWTVNPSTFPVAISSLGLNVSVGNLTVNNTGDVHLYFNLTSSSNLTVYNISENFSLLPGGLKHIRINDNSSTGVKTVVLNVSVNDTAANPRYQTATGTIVVAPGQPILSSSFSTPASEEINAVLGDTVEFVNFLKNFGEGNATNVSVTFTLPQHWIITFGSATSFIGDLASGDSAQQTLRVSIPSTLQAGFYDVYVNATGINMSGVNLTDLNLTFGDHIRITVSEPLTIGGTSGGSSTSSSSGTSSASASGGGSGGSVSFKAKGGASNTIQTVEKIHVARGSGDSVPLTITNLYEHAMMEHIDVRVFGFLSSYTVVSSPINPSRFVEHELRTDDPTTFRVSGAGEHTLTVEDVWDDGMQITLASTPQTLFVHRGKARYADLTGDGLGDVAVDLIGTKGTRALLRIYELRDISKLSLAYGEQLDFSLDVAAPEYLTTSDYNLTVQINAELIPVNSTAAGFTSRFISELRTLLFTVGEHSSDDVIENLADAREAIDEMIDAGFVVDAVKDLAVRADEAIKLGHYDAASSFVAQIFSIHDAAFAAHTTLFSVEQSIAEANSRWLRVPQTQAALDLAQLSFKRGDFVQALERAKSAQLQYALETKSRLNVVWFFMEYWWAIGGGLIIALIIGLLTYGTFIVYIIDQRMRNLEKEEATIHTLLHETQKKYFDDHSMSSGQYKRAVDYYNNRLTDIKKLRISLRTKKNLLLSMQHRISALRTERESLTHLIKENQLDYLIRKKIGRDHFQRIHHDYSARLTSIEHDEAVLEEQLRKDGGFGESRCVQWLQKYVLVLKRLLKKITLPRRALPLTSLTQTSRHSHDGQHVRHVHQSYPDHPTETARHTALGRHLRTLEKHAVLKSEHKTDTEGRHWVPVHASESSILRVAEDRFNIELPKKPVSPAPVVGDAEAAFDAELLRMARTTRKTLEAKDLTLVEISDIRRKAEGRRLQRRLSGGLNADLMDLSGWKQ